jgi:hypothetical protein
VNPANLCSKDENGMRQSLTRHPDSLCRAATLIDVDVARPRAGVLLLSYVVTGKTSDLRLPAVTAAARADELWRHTCFEAFVRPAPGEAYYEFNFASSTQWAAYRFDRYRSGMHVATGIDAPRIEAQAAPERYTLQAVLDLSRLSRDAGCRLGLAAVIEEMSGRKSYWALAHPPGQPDFHHSDCFACEFS